MYKIILISVLIGASILSAATEATLYQYSTPAHLLEGQVGNVVTVQKTKKERIDFALGAGAGLGELIVLDGDYYLADPHGNIKGLHDKDGLSFVTGTHFIAQQKTYHVRDISSMEQLQNIIESNYVSDKNNFYAIKITAKKANIVARSENYQEEPFTPVADWLKHNQNKYSFNNQDVSVVMFRTPDILSQLNARYHAHFISADKKYGGHLLDITSSEMAIQVQKINKIYIWLPVDKFKVIESYQFGATTSYVNVFNNVVESSSS